MNRPLVSVIMPVYNREVFVARAVKSVFAQTYPHWELLVVNDGSTDGTQRVLDSLGSKLTVLQQLHGGPYRARNLALQSARGEFIAFLDSDDYWYPHHLECQLPLFDRREVGLVFGNAVMVNYEEETPRQLAWSFFDNAPPSRGRAFKALTRINFIPQSSVLVRRDCFEKLGHFNLVSSRAADYGKWLHLSLHYEIDFVPECVIEYAIHPENFSRQTSALITSCIAQFEELSKQAIAPEILIELQRGVMRYQLQLACLEGRKQFANMYRVFRAPTGLTAALPTSDRLHVLVEFLGGKITRKWHRCRVRNP